MILHEVNNENGDSGEEFLLALTPCYFNGADSDESFSEGGAGNVFPMPIWSSETYTLSDSDDDENDDMEDDDFDDMEEEDFDDDEDDFDDEDEDDDDEEDDFDDDEDFDEDDDFDYDEE